jgi:hypothetical protein
VVKSGVGKLLSQSISTDEMDLPLGVSPLRIRWEESIPTMNRCTVRKMQREKD